MKITFSRNKYINFRMRKLIYNAMFEKCNDAQLSQQIANACETIVCENFFVKDKRRVIEKNVIVSINKKIA